MVASSAASAYAPSVAEEESVNVVAGIPASAAWPKATTPDQSPTLSAVQPANSASGSVALVATVTLDNDSHPVKVPSPSEATPDMSAAVTPDCAKA